METEKVPKHIGIVLDGNRRFSKKLMMKPWMGHEWGAKKIEKLIEWCVEYKIKELTLYTLSVQNFFSRPKNELNYLLNLFKEECLKLKNDERISRHKIKINFIGRLNLFNDELHGLMKEIMEGTKSNNNLTINFAMAYGGQEEVMDAVKKIAQQVKEGKLDVDKINEEVFENNLYLKNSPELIIRTGGEKRTSNFLNYQAAYSEWIFLEKLWPEFDKEDFVECLCEYSNRSRRFGG
ncbi:di-trans,poly-cis-decaprenylcistransferase [Candidatus Woesearchaeota archaeon]|nr:di-trans,poly-cis-decaprenylcistransferase [Candidatus Woesearchaeota archaeon]